METMATTLFILFFYLKIPYLQTMHFDSTAPGRTSSSFWTPSHFHVLLFISFLLEYDLPSPVGATQVSTDVEPCTEAWATYKRPHHARKMTFPLLAATNCNSSSVRTVAS